MSLEIQTPATEVYFVWCDILFLCNTTMNAPCKLSFSHSPTFEWGLACLFYSTLCFTILARAFKNLNESNFVFCKLNDAVWNAGHFWMSHKILALFSSLIVAWLLRCQLIISISSYVSWTNIYKSYFSIYNGFF
jgi:hypothetical protein